MSAESPGVTPPDQPTALQPQLRHRRLLLGGLLVAAVLAAGWPLAGSTWIQGDEYIFLLLNPDVNPAADAGGDAPGLISRVARIATKVHDDLYQPIPIASYALDFALGGGSPLVTRVIDVLLHALNALLAWWVLQALLTRVAPLAGSPPVPEERLDLTAWALALLWALHPMLVTTWAADMGRTHLLSATFSFAALGLYVRALESRRTADFLRVLGVLLLAMLSKPVVGWVLVAFVLEALAFGPRAAARSWRVAVVGVLCVFFAVLTVWTSRAAGYLQDASTSLFGDPLTRSALATWLYARNLVAAAWLSYWYPPDPRTGWGSPLVWLGLVLAVASWVHAVRCWRRADRRLATLGWTWVWALLLPVIGLVGARESAATDRYFYQPLLGLALVLGALLRPHMARLPVRWSTAPLVGIVVLALGMLVWDRGHAPVFRSTIQRAERLVRLEPGNPRALEALAQAYDYARNHRLAPGDPAPPPDTDPFTHFQNLFGDTLERAAAVPGLAGFFPNAQDLATFHRRLSYRLLTAARPVESLAHAETARQLDPDSYITWARLARSYQALNRFEEALQAYEHAEERLPDNVPARLTHWIDFGNLLMFDLERDSEACERFLRAAQENDGKGVPMAARPGLALCEIRYGRGAVGFELIKTVLQADPQNLRAWLVAGEYHLRSNHWEAAGAAYGTVLNEYPAHYEALRGFQEASWRLGRGRDAVLAWSAALAEEPERREFRSYLVWSLALDGAPTAAKEAQSLLADEPDNPYACLSLSLIELRENKLEAALGWIDRAAAGAPIPRGREFERFAAAVQYLLDEQRLPPEAVVAQAAAYLRGPFGAAGQERARQLLSGFKDAHPDSPAVAVAERLRAEASDGDSDAPP